MNTVFIHYCKINIFVYNYVDYSQVYSVFIHNKQSHLIFAKDFTKNTLSQIKLMLSLRDKNSIARSVINSFINKHCKCDKYIVSKLVTKQICNTIGRHYYDSTLFIKKCFAKSKSYYFDDCMAERIFKIIKKELSILSFDFYHSHIYNNLGLSKKMYPQNY